MNAGTAILITLLGVGFIIWIALAVIGAIWGAVKSSFNAVSKNIEVRNKRREEKEKQAAAEKEKEQIADFRQRHPVQIVGAPNFTLLQTISDQLDKFIATLKYVPQFDFFFPRKNRSDDGPIPEPWHTTLGSLEIQPGRALQQTYDDLNVAEPLLQLPKMQLPSWSIKIIEGETGEEVDVRSPDLAKAYVPEIEQVKTLQHEANTSLTLFKRKWEEAKYFEQRAASEFGPIRNIYKAYLLGKREGIEGHFSLGLEAIALPVPPDYPWRVFYDRDDRIVQINQRVPSCSDIVVNRTDSKRPLAKRDIEYFLRHYVPAISLHVARNVAANDLRDHIDTIAVNCWCRYFEKATGKLKDAFVSALKTDKKTILEININKAGALDAFRALRGAFVFSTEEIVPIEPQIRLDKNDERFVVGKDILDGMAQGQNLATMDWQDFEHLIRELLAKEYGKEGSDVRITRASRDRGVDAVVFDPDPLHGGKYIVQAKRYNNIVDVSAVRDLYGTMLNEGAARGILVTTSRYGRDAFDFASNKPITLIDGQNLLALLAKHGYKFKIELV